MRVSSCAARHSRGPCVRRRRRADRAPPGEKVTLTVRSPHAARSASTLAPPSFGRPCRAEAAHRTPPAAPPVAARGCGGRASGRARGRRRRRRQQRACVASSSGGHPRGGAACRRPCTPPPPPPPQCGLRHPRERPRLRAASCASGLPLGGRHGEARVDDGGVAGGGAQREDRPLVAVASPRAASAAAAGTPWSLALSAWPWTARPARSAREAVRETATAGDAGAASRPARRRRGRRWRRAAAASAAPRRAPRVGASVEQEADGGGGARGRVGVERPCPAGVGCVDLGRGRRAWRCVEIALGVPPRRALLVAGARRSATRRRRP